jgi:predicted DNA-binding ribbon-helix-helix protein
LICQRAVRIAGHATSVSLEDAFWKALREIAAIENTSLSQLVSRIENGRQEGNLSSAIRVFVLKHYRERVSNRETVTGQTTP